MTPKTKRIVDIVATIVPSGLVLLSGTMKFMRGEQVVQGFTALGAFIRDRSIFLPSPQTN